MRVSSVQLQRGCRGHQGAGGQRHALPGQVCGEQQPAGPGDGPPAVGLHQTGPGPALLEVQSLQQDQPLVRHTDRPTGSQTGRQTGSQTHTQTD